MASLNQISPKSFTFLNKLQKPTKTHNLFSQLTFTTTFRQSSAVTSAVAGKGVDVLPPLTPASVDGELSLEGVSGGDGGGGGGSSGGGGGSGHGNGGGLNFDKFINASIVLAAGTFAITKLLTIDHEYWHAGWKLWPFAHLVTYGVIPVEQRLLWVDCVELIWVTILSTYSNEKSEARISEASAEASSSGSSEEEDLTV